MSIPSTTANGPTLSDARADLVFKALSSATRREILELLASGEGAEDSRCCSPHEVCACVFSDRLGVGAPTVSHHMKMLVDAGFVSAEKRGLWVYYRLEPTGFDDLITAVQTVANRAKGSCS